MKTQKIYLNRPSLQNFIDKKDLIGAEVGVLQGKNSFDMLEKLDIKKLYLIDIWSHNGSDKNMSIKRLKKFEDKIIFLHVDSIKACEYIKDNELDFVYIDGDHRYEGVKEDINNYYSKVKMGGLICGHDYGRGKTKDVDRAVNEKFGKENVETDFCLDSINNHSDWWVWKK